jgi:hypothetical protein
MMVPFEGEMFLFRLDFRQLRESRDLETGQSVVQISFAVHPPQNRPDPSLDKIGSMVQPAGAQKTGKERNKKSDQCRHKSPDCRRPR